MANDNLLVGFCTGVRAADKKLNIELLIVLEDFKFQN